jgi:hypothetical protein
MHVSLSSSSMHSFVIVHFRLSISHLDVFDPVSPSQLSYSLRTTDRNPEQFGQLSVHGRVVAHGFPSGVLPSHVGRPCHANANSGDMVSRKQTARQNSRVLVNMTLPLSFDPNITQQQRNTH